MNSKVNATLMAKLFINPAPLGERKDVFDSLYHRMFPCKDVFVLFLKVDMNEQIECAKYIIQRLCFESNFPPPYSLMTNLTDFEHGDENLSYNDAYIPQDHFLHIVYMYLLGIYTYFYMPEINSALTNEFIRKRRDKSYFATLDAAKDFLSYWKYFCLYHDLAYPVERKLKDRKSEANGEDHNNFITPINGLFTLLSEEILAECAAKLIVLWQLINDKNNTPFSNMLLALPDTEIVWERNDRKHFETEEMRAKFETYKKVDKIYIYEHFKMFSGYLAQKNYLVVLFDAKNEQPVAIREKATDKTVYYFLKNANIRLSRPEAIKLLDNEDVAIPGKYKIRFFIRYDGHECEDFFFMDDAINKFGKDRYEAALALTTSDFVKRPVPNVTFQKITNSDGLGNYMFQVYCSVLNYIDEMKNMVEEPFNNSLTALKVGMIKGKYLKLMRGSLQKEIKDSFIEAFELDKLIDVDGLIKKQNMRILRVDDIIQTISMAFDKILKSEEIEGYVDKISTRISEKLLDKLEKTKNGNGALIELLFACYECIAETGVKLEFGISTNCIIDLCKTFDDMLSKKVFSALEEDVQHRMDEFAPNKKCGLDQWMNQYRTPYIAFDHGIVDSLLFLSSIQYYRRIVDKVFTKNDAFSALLSTLCWNVDRNKYQNKLQEDYGHISQAVMNSICYHNIYPSALEEIYGEERSKWYYTFQDTPTTYFAMMIDSLQIWGRDKYYSKRALDHWPNISSDGVNISIKDNHIILQLEAYNNNLTKLEKKYISDVEEYLKELSAFVHLEVMQSR